MDGLYERNYSYCDKQPKVCFLANMINFMERSVFMRFYLFFLSFSGRKAEKFGALFLCSL